MSVSEFPIPNKDKDRRGPRRERDGESQGETIDEDGWSPRLRLIAVVLSSLILWSGIFLVASWIW